MRLHLLRGRFDYTETSIRDATHLRWFTETTIRALVGRCALDLRCVRHSAGNDPLIGARHPTA
jgi:hypothetical protein